jgi:hypothetical protein
MSTIKKRLQRPGAFVGYLAPDYKTAQYNCQDEIFVFCRYCIQ